MKKIYIGLGVLFIISMIIFSVSYALNKSTSFKGDEKIYAVNTNHSMVMDEGKSMEVIIYSNNPKSVLSAYDNSKMSFTDNKSGNILAGEIIDSYKIDETYYFDEHLHIYKLIIATSTLNSKIVFTECILNTEHFKIHIGTLTLTPKRQSDSFIDVLDSYVLGNSHLGFKSVNGLVLTIQNTSNEKLNIRSINIGDFVKVSLADYTIISKQLEYNTNIKDYVHNYNPLKNNTTQMNITINAKDSLTLLFPVTYLEKSFLGNFNININDEYYIDNIEYLESYYLVDQYSSILTHGYINTSK